MNDDAPIEIYDDNDKFTAIINGVVYQINPSSTKPTTHIGLITQDDLTRDDFGEKTTLDDCPQLVQEEINQRIPQPSENTIGSDLFD